MASRFVRGALPGHERVATLTFEPADARAVLDVDALESLLGAVDALRGEPNVEAVALFGARDDLFAAGADLDALARLSPVDAERFADLGRSVLAAWETLHATTVAVVRGACYGGALDLVLSTDVVVAFETARFAHPGVHR
ncbi:MAG TPA: enoyl-CoA hydratase-related protein, partial [Thermoanaerobaculia bacterium]|nr:enoyl-CoA hydratase-related protein [Thermoanaerobaculia bacterium]